MNRLQAEWRRLYLPQEHGTDMPELVDDGRVRAMVLELVRPAGWMELSTVWRGVQVDLDMPAPAIAVSGRDAYQLWFALSEAVQVDQVAAFLDALCRRYLGAVPPERVRMTPAADGRTATSGPNRMARLPAQVAPERWAAFVAADLAPLFADEPWLDHPPGDEAQADLLSRLALTTPDTFARALDRLQPPGTPAGARNPPAPAAAAAPERRPAMASPSAARAGDPRRFLLDVMNDPEVDLRLRIEAAKALLPYVDNAR